MELEVGHDPTRTGYLPATTEGISFRASPEDSSNLVPHFGFEPNLPLYEGRVRTVRARRKMAGDGRLARPSPRLECGSLLGSLISRGTQ